MGDLKTAWAIQNAVLENKRPSVPKNVPDGYGGLMVSCWSQEPSSRPTFDEIIGRLELVRGALDDSNTTNNPFAGANNPFSGVNLPPPAIRTLTVGSRDLSVEGELFT